jgi:hypothetical protein
MQDAMALATGTWPQGDHFKVVVVDEKEKTKVEEGDVLSKPHQNNAPYAQTMRRSGGIRKADFGNRRQSIIESGFVKLLQDIVEPMARN